MTRSQFQKQVTKSNGYDKYWFFLLYTAATCLGSFLLYDVIAHQAKYDKHGTRYLGFCSSLFFVFMGVLGLFLVPNRYKVLTVQSLLPIDKKKQIILELVKEIGNPFCDTIDTFYSFIYKKNWWASSYKILLSMDTDNLYISVQSRTDVYAGGGIIDFGSTERVRQKIINCLTNILERQ